jgi:nitrite reductase/ring-hydroxylating ferredoxin subunit
MTKHTVGTVSEIPPGKRKIVEVGGRSIGVFNVSGKFYALRNRCPHQGGPLCRGSVSGTMLPSRPGEYRWGRAGEIVRCPWHGWEFDITTGQSICNPHRTRVRAYEVTVEDEDPSVESYRVTVEDRYVVVHL